MKEGEIAPVIQSGMAELFIIGPKPHGAHQMKGGAGHGAGAGDVSGVLGNFRLHQNDVKRGHSITCNFKYYSDS